MVDRDLQHRPGRRTATGGQAEGARRVQGPASDDARGLAASEGHRHAGQPEGIRGQLPADLAGAAGRQRTAPDPGTRDRFRRSVPRTAPQPGGRTAVHQGEPAGHDRGAGDQQRRAAGHERGTGRVERRTAEHERGTALGQRGAVHGQRGVPAQDRRTDRIDRRHGQPAVQHRRGHDVPGRRPVHPQVHAEDRRVLRLAAAGHRPPRVDLCPQYRSRRAAGRRHARADHAGGLRAGGARPARQALPAADPAVPRQGARRRRRGHDHRHFAAETGRSRAAPDVQGVHGRRRSDHRRGPAGPDRRFECGGRAGVWLAARGTAWPEYRTCWSRSTNGG